MPTKTLSFLIIICLISTALAYANPDNHPQNSHEAFFKNLETLLGQAFEGKVVVGNEHDKTFSDNKLIMHVRAVDKNTLYIPFHVGESRSRTWIITRTESGLKLQHDHRHKDGTPEEMNLYGGHTKEEGWPNAQSFPADQYTKDIFVKGEIPQSAGNTWHMYIYPGKTFTYRLTREGREFRVDFDLTKPITPPPPPWGYETN